MLGRSERDRKSLVRDPIAVCGPVRLDICRKVGEAESTGVGLANIRDRLSQAYGADHRFETESNATGGFRVTIEIPFQLEVPEEPK